MTSKEELMAEIDRTLRRLRELPVFNNTGIFTLEIIRGFLEDTMGVIRSTGSTEEKRIAFDQLKEDYMRRLDELDNPPNI